jgi:Glycosyl hydrolase family 9/Cellulase N-terminal ig-like domain
VAFVPRTRVGIIGVVAAITGVVVIAILVLSGSKAPNPGARPSPGLSAGGSSAAPRSTPTVVPGPSPTAGSPAVSGVVRVDQLGYLPGESKVAYLLAAAPAAGALFTVLDAAGAVVLQGAAGPDRGPWNDAWPAVHPLDLTPLTTPGTYKIELTGAVVASSPPFRIGTSAELFAPRVDDAVAFFQAQRDGPDVIPGELGRKPSHLNDRDLDVFGWPKYEDPDSDAIVGNTLTRVERHVDLAGGWFDAGDFIKFTHTTAYSVGLMYLAERELGPSAAAPLVAEARFGQDWLERAWDPATGTMYLQVGIGSGNTDGTFLGDHDLWRLPEQDDALAGADNRFLRSRPAFRANDPGKPLPPNLAGRVAAALALAAQVDANRDPALARRELETAAAVYGRAKTTNVKGADVVTALPHAFYPESSWRDDLEWAAAELALAGQALGDGRADDWLRGAAKWAASYLDHEAGDDTLNLYDTSAVAHADLVRAIRAAPSVGGLALDEARLIADLRAQLEIGVKRSDADPFGAGAIYDDFDAAPHTFGLIVTARVYGALTGDRTYDGFATRQRDWALGANAWGASFMIGVGTDFPRCPQHVAANLLGSPDGSPPILRGAVVNGPNSADLFVDGLGEFFDEGHACPADGLDPHAQFTGHGSRYVDDVRSWQTVEPAIDFTAAALLAFALL